MDPEQPSSTTDDYETTRALIAFFDHPIQDKRHEALRRAISLGEGAVRALVEAMDSPASEPYHRIGAVRALAEIASPRAIPGLVRFVRSHGRDAGDMRAFAVQAIARATTADLEQGPKIMQFAQGLLSDKDDFVRAYAYSILGALRNTHARALVEKGTQDRDPFVAEKAAEALALLAATPNSPAQVEHNLSLMSHDEIAFALQSGQEARRTLGREALFSWVQDRDFNPDPLVLKLLHGPNRIGKRSALDLIGQLRSSTLVPHLISSLQSPNLDADLQAHALRSLAHARDLLQEQPDLLDHETTLRLLRTLLAHPNLPVRSAAVAALSIFPSTDSVSLLIQSAQDAEAWIRDEATTSLQAQPLRALKPFSQAIAKACTHIVQRIDQRAKDTAKVRSVAPHDDALDQKSLGRLLSILLDLAADSPATHAISTAAFSSLAAPTAALRLQAMRLLHTLALSSKPPVVRHEQDLRALAFALTSTDVKTVCMTLDILEEILPKGSSAATDDLTEVLYRGDAELALRAIDLLGRAGDVRARSALQALTNNMNLEIAAAAIAALRDKDTLHV